MKILLSAIVLLFLTACSAIATKDIDQAIGLATTANDNQGLACLQAQKLIFGAEPIGIFTVMEQGRLSQRALAICGGVVPGAPVQSAVYGAPKVTK